jgi:predicted anti-sigma-YlaC factor YlaD
MTKPDCEIVCMAAMARADGYVSELSVDQMEAHLAECPDCRNEVQQLQALAGMLAGQKRQQPSEDVWRKVSDRLPRAVPSRITSRTWFLLVVLGVLLLGYRLLEMIPDRHFGILFKLVPVLLVVAAFSYLRENPFKINTELKLEGGATR